MNPKLPSPEEFLAEIQKTQEDLSKLRTESWEKVEPEINKMLSDAGFPDAPIRDVYKQILKVLWFKGYSSGATDMARYMGRQLGAGPFLDAFELELQRATQKPENN